MTAFNQIFAERPELIALAVFALAFAAVRSATKRLTLPRILLGALFFLGFTYLLFQARQIPYLAPVTPKDALARFLGDALKIVWWFWAASLASEALRLYAARGHTPLSRYRLSQDLSVAGIYLCALIGLSSYVLNLPLQGLFVTSGAVAVVLGLALQSALGDVFYGIVLSLAKPYHLGDWVTLDNGVEGIVVEMNWRATHLLTDRLDIAIVPNSVIARARLVNSSFPSRTHGTCIQLPVAAQASPERAVEVLLDAALGCRQVLIQPPPTVVVKAMSADATIFEITFFTPEVGVAPAAQTAVYENIFRGLRVAGIALGSSVGSAAAAKTAADLASLPELQRLLDSSGLFAQVTADERLNLTRSLERVDYEPGQVVVEQGSAVPALLIAASGVLSLKRRTGERVDEIARISAGGYVGADELRQNIPATASVTALRHSTVYHLDKAVFLSAAMAQTLSHEKEQGPAQAAA
jgi:small-conductance mechanosensitive channel